jgi:hypothetical protein
MLLSWVGEREKWFYVLKHDFIKCDRERRNEKNITNCGRPHSQCNATLSTELLSNESIFILIFSFNIETSRGLG